MKIDMPCKELGCTSCCRWGNQAQSIKVEGVIATPDGSCQYVNDSGCAVYGTSLRPKVCESYSCVDFLNKILEQPNLLPMTALIAAAVAAKINVESKALKKGTKSHDNNGS